MRPLNRPMFKMGGPIKEGIMQGMKEPQAINTVGSPLAPTDASGRQGYAIPIFAGLGAAAMRFFPAAYRGYKAARTYKPFSENLGFIGRTKDLLLPKGGISAPMAPKGAGAGFRVGSFLKQNPLTALPIAGTAIEGVGRAGAGLAKMSPDLLRQYANQVIPFADPFKDDSEKPKKAGEGEVKVVKEIGAGEGTTGGSVVEDPNKAKQIQEDRIAKTKKRYYELMGLDKMKKDAAYDSLLDASNIVLEEGADLKGAIKSGTLQNRIINAISKNLDKSADIKRQIDAAVLKGEIEKDIKGADTTDKRLKEARIKQLDRAEQNASASGQLAAVRAEKGFVPGATTAAILRKENIEYDTVIQDKLITDFLEDNPTKTEADYIASLGIQLPDGRYVVGERLVEKKGNEVAFIV